MFIPNPGVLRRVLKFYIEGSRGGAARLRVLLLLDKKPMNVNEISRRLLVDYKTAQHHIRLMEKLGIIVSKRKAHGNSYGLSELLRSDEAAMKYLKNMGKSR